MTAAPPRGNTLSCGGDSAKASDKDNDDAVGGFVKLDPNLKGGSEDSWLDLRGTSLVLKPFVLDNTGRSGPVFLLSGGSMSFDGSTVRLDGGGDGRESMDESAGVNSGIGDCRLISNEDPKGALCGKGDMSIESMLGPGDEEGTGGVVTPPKYHG